MSDFIGICGKARSGKDTIANYLVENHGYIKVAFADPIRDAFESVFGYRPPDEEKERKVPGFDFSPREWMQKFGTDFGREMLDDQIWLKLWYKKVVSLPKVVVPDVRFDNEAQMVKSFDGEIWNVRRPGVMEVAQHKSENSLSEECIDKRLSNEYDLDELYMKIERELNRG